MRTQSTIDQLRVATPCPASWEHMTGTDRVRFCDQCQLNVYNLSELTRNEAEALIASSEGRLCGRFFRRADGTVLTKDCPVGLRALRLRVSKRVAAVFAAMVSITSVALGQQSTAQENPASCPTQTRVTRLETANNPNTIAGTVHDIVGNVIANAAITINSASLPAPRTVTSNEQGLFQFGLLPNGTYSISIEGFVYQPLNLNEVVIENSQAVAIDFVLHGQVFTGLITVAIDPNLLAPKPKPNTTVIDENMIKRLPMQRNNEIPFLKY